MGHGAHQVVKLRDDGFKVWKNIGMVIFQIIEYGHAWTVMNKLRALIKKCSVVFVRLNHEPGSDPDGVFRGKLGG